MIGLLPEVVQEEEQLTVTEALEELLNEDTDILVPIMDAVMNMSLSDKLKTRMVALILEKLDAADLSDLPAVVRFVLQSATGTNVREVVQHLRGSLNFIAGVDARFSAPDRKQKGKESGCSSEAQVLESLRSGLQFNSTASDQFLKEIKGATSDQHKVIDVWVLLVLHTFGGNTRKLVLATLQKKFVGHHITPQLLSSSVIGDSLVTNQSSISSRR